MRGHRRFRGTQTKEKSTTVSVDDRSKTILVEMIDRDDRVVISVNDETAREIIKGLTMAIEHIENASVIDGSS